MRGFRRRDRRAAVPGPAVERVDRDLLRVTAPDGRAVVLGCESYAGTLTLWLGPGLRWGGGGDPITEVESTAIEAQVAAWAVAQGLRLAVERV